MVKRTKKILVAGGAGFIGSHLCEFLVKQGHQVFCWDNLSTGSKQNVRHLLPEKKFKFSRWDATKPRSLAVDEIYHLASPASPVHYQRMPLQTFQANVQGTLNLLELARRQKAKILFASTSEVYGDPLVHPQSEKYWGNVNCAGVRSCYDEGKRAGETLCSDFHRVYGLPAKIVRIFNTYGPRMALNDGRVVSNFIVQALTGKPLTIYGDGKQTRSFQYVDDLVSGLVRMMEKKDITGPVNLGNPGEFTMLELAEKIISLTKSKSRIVYKELPADDPCRRKPDITLAKLKLNWQPKVPLKEGLAKTIAYFKQILD